MGKTYTAKVTLSCVKQHTCIACSSKYSYHLLREITGSGSSEQAAVNQAENLAASSVEGDVDFHPCPHCGVVQPEMTADVRSSRFWIGLVLLVIGVGVALLLGLTQVVTIATSAWIAAGVGLAALCCFAWGAFYNPNGNLDTNRATSQAKISQQVLSLDEPGASPDPMQSDGHEGLAAVNLFALATAAFAVLIAASPPLMCIVGGWTQNDSCYPAVVGPGDTTCFYFDQKIQSLKGYWRGSAAAEVQNAGELALAQNTFRGETKKSNWGDSISSDSSSNSSNKMWMKLEFPDDEKLANQTLDLNLSVNATYPFAMGNVFDDKRGNYTKSAVVTLSSPGSGTLYHRLWWMGQIVVIGLFIVAGAVLLGTCRALRSRGNPVAVAAAE